VESQPIPENSSDDFPLDVSACLFCGLPEFLTPNCEPHVPGMDLSSLYLLLIDLQLLSTSLVGFERSQHEENGSRASEKAGT
jgi:hypothetical protein